MDNIELYSEIRKVDLNLFALRSNVSDRIWKIWLVMFLAFYFFTLFGLYLIHRAYADAVEEMQHELAAMHLSSSLQGEHVSSADGGAGLTLDRRPKGNSMTRLRTPQ